MNERQIQLRLAAELRSTCCCAAPNYTPRGWWECDVWAVTKAGYAVEYEIKLSVEDFKADARKTRRRHSYHGPGNWTWTDESKHDLIRTSEHAPSRFFYVVRSEIVDEVQPLLPEWAGLIRARTIEHHRLPHLIQIQPAPRIHKRKASAREVRLAMTRMWHRYWAAIGHIDRLVLDLQKRGVPCEFVLTDDDPTPPPSPAPASGDADRGSDAGG